MGEVGVDMSIVGSCGRCPDAVVDVCSAPGAIVVEYENLRTSDVTSKRRECAMI